MSSQACRGGRARSPAARIVIYFTAGGLLGSAWVNTFQLIVMLVGLLVALPVAISSAGGFAAITAGSVPAQFGDIFYSAGSGSGSTLLFLLGPAFIISPGLIQKAYGGASTSAVRTGVALNAAGLLTFACVPVLFGMIADHPAGYHGPERRPANRPDTRAAAVAGGDCARRGVLDRGRYLRRHPLHALDIGVEGSLRRFLNPGASDAQELLRVGRAAAVAGGAVGVLSIWLQTVIGAITVFSRCSSSRCSCQSLADSM